MSPARAPDDAVLLGIDAGLSYLKVAAFDPRGRLVVADKRPYLLHRPAPGVVEEPPEQWIDQSAELIRQFVADGHIRPEQVAGISVSARGNGGIFVDQDGQVLYPHWRDGREREQSRRLRERFGPFGDNRTLPSKTLWFRENRPELFERLAHPLFAKDYLLYRLSGAVATDPSTGPPGHVWPPDVWDAVGFPVERVPQVRPHTAIGGELLPGVAAQFGLPAGIPVGVGGHDGACANAGAGSIEVGSVCLTMGTNGVARSIGPEPFPTESEEGISCYHYLPGRLCRGGDMGMLGHAPTWLASIVGADFAALEPAAATVAPGSEGVTFLPFLVGERSPRSRAGRRASFLGLHGYTDRATLYRAVLEGTGGLITLVANRLNERGFGNGEWRVSGGGANSQLWLDVIAAMMNRPLYLGEPEEGPRGAVMFLAVGLGWFDSVEDCAREWIKATRVVEPDRRLVDAYAPWCQHFRRLSDAIYEAERAAEGGTDDTD